MVRLHRILDGLTDALMIVSGVCIALMMLVIVADATARGLFNAAVPGAQELTSNYFMLAVTFPPLACVQRHKAHVLIELFTTGLPARAVHGIDACVHFACAVASLIFCYATYLKALAMTRANEYAIGTVMVTIWPGRWIMVAGLLVLALYLFLHSVEDVWMALGRGPHDVAPADEDVVPL